MNQGIGDADDVVQMKDGKQKPPQSPSLSHKRNSSRTDSPFSTLI